MRGNTDIVGSSNRNSKLLWGGSSRAGSRGYCVANGCWTRTSVLPYLQGRRGSDKSHVSGRRSDDDWLAVLQDKDGVGFVSWLVRLDSSSHSTAVAFSRRSTMGEQWPTRSRGLTPSLFGRSGSESHRSAHSSIQALRTRVVTLHSNPWPTRIILTPSLRLSLSEIP